MLSSPPPIAPPTPMPVCWRRIDAISMTERMICNHGKITSTLFIRISIRETIAENEMKSNQIYKIKNPLSFESGPEWRFSELPSVMTMFIPRKVHIISVLPVAIVVSTVTGRKDKCEHIAVGRMTQAVIHCSFHIVSCSRYKPLQSFIPASSVGERDA